MGEYATEKYIRQKIISYQTEAAINERGYSLGQ